MVPEASIISNIVDLKRFSPRPWAVELVAPHCIVTRNFEPYTTYRRDTSVCVDPQALAGST